MYQPDGARKVWRTGGSDTLPEGRQGAGQQLVDPWGRGSRSTQTQTQEEGGLERLQLNLEHTYSPLTSPRSTIAMENMKNGLEEGCIEAENSSEVHDTHSLKSGSSDDESLRSRTSIKQHLQEYLRSTPCQVLLVGLVIVDILLVIAELMLDLGFKDSESPLPFVFHALSLSVMSIFVIEIALKIYAYQLEFLTHKGDVFDAVIVIVCFCLDAVYLHSHDAHAGVGFMIVLRLWRVAHIQRAIVSQIKSSGDKKLLQEEEKRYQVEQEIERCRTNGYAQEAYIKHLEGILRKNNISIPEHRSPPGATSREFAVEVIPE